MHTKGCTQGSCLTAKAAKLNQRRRVELSVTARVLVLPLSPVPAHLVYVLADIAADHVHAAMQLGCAARRAGRRHGRQRHPAPLPRVHCLGRGQPAGQRAVVSFGKCRLVAGRGSVSEVRHSAGMSLCRGPRKLRCAWLALGPSLGPHSTHRMRAPVMPPTAMSRPGTPEAGQAWP